MSDIKTKVQRLDPNVAARDINEFKSKAGSVYEALAVISKRAKQLQVDIKEELKAKLDEFEVVSDTIEEIQENKEQIEISKFYERLPNPALIATNEFLNGELTWRERDITPDQEEV
jgi:DNA-directed RNA polymerase subunit K/omega